MNNKKAPLLSSVKLKADTKKRIKRMLPGIVSTAVVLAVVIITIFQSTDGFTSIIETEPAKIVTEKDYMSFTAYTLKNEKVLTSSYSGGVYYLADNAQKVNPGDKLAEIYENKLDDNTVNTLNEIDRCIAILEESINNGTFTLGESKEVTNRLSTIYYDMMRSLVDGNASTVSILSDDFLILLNKIKIYSGNSEEIKLALNEYKSKKATLEENYSGNNELITAESGGYFFRKIDGYENVYSSSNIKNLTYDSFWEMTDKPADDGDYVGKLLLDYRWYMIIPTVKGISDTYYVGSYYDITFPDSQNRTFEMKLDNIIFDSTGSRSLMVFECGVIDKGFDYSRVQQVNITNRNVSGYKVPISAVCEIGGNTGVYILKDGMATFRKISILYEGDGYYIVSSKNSNSSNYFIYLEPNDSIIIDCKNMYEGKIIGG